MINLSNFLVLHQETGLIAVFLILLIYDIFGNQKSRKWFRLTACILLGLQTLTGFIPQPSGTVFGGMFVSSTMTVLMKNILNIATLFIFMQSGQWLRKPGMKKREGEFYVLLLITLLGMYFMISANNFMLLYIGIETASLPMACLVALHKYHEKSAEAGAKFILISALSSGVMMFGLSYLYGALGTMYFEDMASSMTITSMTVLGLVFFFAGLAFKISLVPFHLWAADVYEGAPTSVTAYLSIVSKAAGSFTLIFTFYHVFREMEYLWHHVLWLISVLTITVGNLFAIRQQDIKRFFAFSSISQAGYILLGIIAGTAQGMTATVYFVLIYLFSNLLAFGVITSIENHTERTDINVYNGLSSSNPKLALVMMLALFSLAGIPPFAGFFSKFFIFAAAAEQGEYVLIFIALINTVISLYYYLLIVKAMYINQSENTALATIQTDNYNRLSLILCTCAVILIGILSGVYHYINIISNSY